MVPQQQIPQEEGNEITDTSKNPKIGKHRQSTAGFAKDEMSKILRQIIAGHNFWFLKGIKDPSKPNWPWPMKRSCLSLLLSTLHMSVLDQIAWVHSSVCDCRGWNLQCRNPSDITLSSAAVIACTWKHRDKQIKRFITLRPCMFTAEPSYS